MSLPIKGFSLIEILFVLAILSLLGASGLYVSYTSIGRLSLQDDTKMLALLLQKARSHAQSNIDTMPWGVCTTSNSLILFSGNSYTTDSHEETLSHTSTITGIECSTGGVLFAPLSGNTTDTTIDTHHTGNTKKVFINHAGRIETN